MAILASMVEAQIAEAAREAAQEAAFPPAPKESPVAKRPFASSRTLVVAWTLCLGLSVANLEFDGLFTPRPVDPSTSDLVAGLRTSAAISAVLIEDYRSQHGVLPSSLAAVGLPDDDPMLEYRLTEGASYRMIVRHGEFEGVFDSRLEAQRRASAAEERAAEARRLAAERAERVAGAERRLADARGRVEELRRRAQEEQARESFR